MLPSSDAEPQPLNWRRGFWGRKAQSEPHQPWRQTSHDRRLR